MATGMGRNAIAPLLVLNLIMYIVVIGFASYGLNHFINGTLNRPGWFFCLNYLLFFCFFLMGKEYINVSD
jgi:AWPM-19-like family